MDLYIQKYGGSSVASLERIQCVADHLAQCFQSGMALVVVVSAMGEQTDELLDMALQLHPDPPQRELDMLLSVGERISMALLAIALHKRGIPTISFTGSQSGILTDDQHGNAKIQTILGDRLRKALDERKLVIVAGFQGMSIANKEITTLGRGGSDLTAIALAYALKAKSCQIFKDVDGVCSADPRFVPQAKVLSKMSWETLSSLTWYGSGVVHNRGVHLAQKYKIPLEIRSSFHFERKGTAIGGEKSVEMSYVSAITHRLGLIRLCLLQGENSRLADILSFLYTLGDHPVFAQEQRQGAKLQLDLVFAARHGDKVEALLKQQAPECQILSKTQPLGSISIIGEGFWQDPRVLAKIHQSLTQKPLLMDSKNSLVTLLYAEEELDKLLPQLHQELIEAKLT